MWEWKHDQYGNSMLVMEGVQSHVVSEIVPVVTMPDKLNQNELADVLAEIPSASMAAKLQEMMHDAAFHRSWRVELFALEDRALFVAQPKLERIIVDLVCGIAESDGAVPFPMSSSTGLRSIQLTDVYYAVTGVNQSQEAPFMREVDFRSIGDAAECVREWIVSGNPNSILKGSFRSTVYTTWAQVDIMMRWRTRGNIIFPFDDRHRPDPPAPEQISDFANYVNGLIFNK